MDSFCILPRYHLLSLTLVPVGFYAGLNLLAWFMVFCFVRETKQLTLEELDRESSLTVARFIYGLTDVSRRGLLGAHEKFHLL